MQHIAIQYTQLGLPDKGHTIKGLVVIKWLRSRAFRPAKLAGTGLLSTIWGIYLVIKVLNLGTLLSVFIDKYSSTVPTQLLSLSMFSIY